MNPVMMFLLKTANHEVPRHVIFIGLYYSGRQSQQSFLLSSPSTHSLHVSARVGHLQVNILFEASYCLLTDPLFGLSLHILSLITNRYVLQLH
jgi:hypothetical protein